MNLKNDETLQTHGDKMKKIKFLPIIAFALFAGALSISAQWQQDNFVIMTGSNDVVLSPETQNHFTTVAGSIQIDTMASSTPQAGQTMSNSALININRQYVGLVKNAYFNAMSDNFFFCQYWRQNGYPFNAALENDYRLWLAQFWGLKSLVTCTPNNTILAYFKTMDASIPAATSIVKNICDHFKNLDAGRRSAMLGYNLVDEPGYTLIATNPSLTQIQNTNLWVNQFQIPTNDPAMLSYVNALCRTDEVSDPLTTIVQTQYLNSLFWNSTQTKNPQVLCLDNYPIHSGLDAGGHIITWMESDFYYSNLNLLRNISIQTGRPFWMVVNNEEWEVTPSIRDVGFPNPTESDLRFEFLVPIAYGAKGIQEYAFNDFADVPSSTDAFQNNGSHALVSFGRTNAALPYGEIDAAPAGRPLCADTGTDGRNWTKLAVTTEINRYITNIVGPVIMTSNNNINTGVFSKVRNLASSSTPHCYGYSFPTTQYLPSTTGLLNDLSDDSLMAGVFQDKVTPTTYYIFVVNKRCLDRTNSRNKMPGVFSITLNGNYSREKVFLAPRCYNYIGSTVFTAAPTAGTGSGSTGKLKIWFADALEGGEGRLIKVTGVGTGNTAAGFRPQGEIAAIRGSTGKVFCFARGTDNCLWYRQQETTNCDYWGSKWTSLGGSVNGNIVCGFLSKTDRHLLVLSKNSSNVLRAKYQTDAINNLWNTGSYGTWTDVIDAKSKICATRWGPNEYLVALYKRNSDKKLACSQYQSTTNGVLQFTSTAVSGSMAIGNYIAAGYNPGYQTTDIFVTAASNNQLYCVRAYPNGSIGTFAAMTKPLHGITSPMTSTSEIAVGINPDNGNLLEVVVASGGSLYHSYQNTPGGTWSSFYKLTTNPINTPEVPTDTTASVSFGNNFGNNGNGYLELFARGNDGFIKHMWRDLSTTACPACNCWSCSNLVNLGNFATASVTGGMTHIAVTNYQDGRQAVFTTCDGNANVFYTSQVLDPSLCDWQVFVPFTNNN